MNSNKSKIPMRSVHKPAPSSNMFGGGHRKMSQGSDTGLYLGFSNVRQSSINPPSSAQQHGSMLASANKTCYFSAQKPGFSMCSSAKKSIAGHGVFNTTPQSNKAAKLRLSMATSARKSSIMGDRRRVQDDRPLSDRHYHQQCIAKVITFLTEYGYPHKIQPTTFLKTLSNNELTKVFEFIFSFLDPTWKVTPLDTEIPKLLQFAGYPFNVNKSCLVSATSNTSRGQLLGILEWLVDIVSYANRLDIEDIVPQNDFGEKNVKLSILGMLLKNPSEDEKAAFFQDLEHEMFGAEEDIEKLIIEQDEIEKEIDLIDEEIQQQEMFPATIEAFEEDVKKCDKYLQEMQEHLKANQEILTELNEELAAQQKVMQKLEDEKQEVEKRVNEQKFDIDDVNYAKERQIQVDESILNEKQEIERLKKQIRVIKLECKKQEDGLLRLCSDAYLQVMAFKNVLTSPNIVAYSPVFVSFFERPEWQQILKSPKELTADSAKGLRESFSRMAHELKVLITKEASDLRVKVLLQEKQNLHEAEMVLAELKEKVKGFESNIEAASVELDNIRKEQAEELLALNQALAVKQKEFAEREAKLQRSQEEIKERIRNLQTDIDKKDAEVMKQEKEALKTCKEIYNNITEAIAEHSKEFKQDLKACQSNIEPLDVLEAKVSQAKEYVNKKLSRKLRSRQKQKAAKK